MIYAGRFAGRTAVITGGASGLGLEAAKRIAAEGGKVCSVGSQPPTRWPAPRRKPAPRM